MKKTTKLFLSLALLSTMTMTAGSLAKGVDPANLDTSTKPGEDFYQYACGGWMKANPLDPQYSRFGTFDQLAENNREQLKNLILGLSKAPLAQGTNAKKVADIFNVGMVSVRLNKEGIMPVAQDLG